VCSADAPGSVGDSLVMVGAGGPVDDLLVALDMLGHKVHEVGVALDSIDGVSEFLLRDVPVARHPASVPA
jgi:hypothetical protein